MPQTIEPRIPLEILSKIISQVSVDAPNFATSLKHRLGATQTGSLHIVAGISKATRASPYHIFTNIFAPAINLTTHSGTGYNHFKKSMSFQLHIYVI